MHIGGKYVGRLGVRQLVDIANIIRCNPHDISFKVTSEGSVTIEMTTMFTDTDSKGTKFNVEENVLIKDYELIAHEFNTDPYIKEYREYMLEVFGEEYASDYLRYF